MKAWVNPYSIGLREVSDRDFKKLWLAASWEEKHANDPERTRLEFDRLMEHSER